MIFSYIDNGAGAKKPPLVPLGWPRGSHVAGVDQWTRSTKKKPEPELTARVARARNASFCFGQVPREPRPRPPEPYVPPASADAPELFLRFIRRV